MSDRLTSANSGPRRGDRIWFEGQQLCWRRATRSEALRDWIVQHITGPVFRTLVWPTLVRLYCWLYGFKSTPQEYPHMNLSLQITGSRSTVLEYLAALATAPTVNETSAASTADTVTVAANDAQANARKAIASALTDYITSAPDGADHFTLNAELYIGWQVPTPDGT